MTMMVIVSSWLKIMKLIGRVTMIDYMLPCVSFGAIDIYKFSLQCNARV